MSTGGRADGRRGALARLTAAAWLGAPVLAALRSRPAWADGHGDGGVRSVVAVTASTAADASADAAASSSSSSKPGASAKSSANASGSGSGSGSASGTGTVWRVERGDSLARALGRAADGDTVELAEGDHHGQTGTVTQRALVLRGAGRGAVLHADGRDAEGKAIVVVRHGDVRVEGITFRGARVADANGAGIRFERGRLTVERCGFFDNEMGLLTGNVGDTELLVRDCRFGAAPVNPLQLAHLVYVGRIARFTLTGSHLGGGRRGHLVKSRARVHRVVANHLVDGADGEASYELEFPEGGDALVVGNVLHQSTRSHNRTLLAYGAEGPAYDGPALSTRMHALRLAHNTFVSDDGDGAAAAVFVRLPQLRWWRSGAAPPAALLRNNLFVGSGAADGLPWSDGERRQRPAVDGNHALPRDALPGIAAGDYRLARDHPLRGRAVPLDATLRPALQFRAPVGVQPVDTAQALSPGAAQA